MIFGIRNKKISPNGAAEAAPIRALLSSWFDQVRLYRATSEVVDADLSDIGFLDLTLSLEPGWGRRGWGYHLS